MNLMLQLMFIKILYSVKSFENNYNIKIINVQRNNFKYYFSLVFFYKSNVTRLYLGLNRLLALKIIDKIFNNYLLCIM